MKKIIGKNISILYRNEQNYLDVKLKKYNLNKVQAEVMKFLNHNNGVNQTKINEYFLFNKANITKIITHLEKYDYVRRLVSENDRREKDIFLTDKGRDMLQIIKECFKEWEDILIDNISSDDIEKTKCVLAEMVDNVINMEGNQKFNG